MGEDMGEDGGDDGSGDKGEQPATGAALPLSSPQPAPAG